MRTFLKTAIRSFLLTFIAGAPFVGMYRAYAQVCPVPAPVVAPTAVQVVINLPGDGGTTGCTGYAITTTGKNNPNVYPIGNAKCAAAAAFGLQAVANDNGWTDGGTPQ